MSNLYKSKEWKSLIESARAQLLLVIEGLKKGTIIDADMTPLLKILKNTGLDYQLNSNSYDSFPVVRVAKPHDLQQLNSNILAISNHGNGNNYHRVIGEFLSYPKCCIEEYVKDPTLEEKKAAKPGKRYLSYRFGRELTDLINRKGSYPDVFDYRPQSFTPCSINCEESIGLLSKWKNALETYDPKAARVLVYCNRISKPQRWAHEDYLKKEFF